MFLNAGIIAGSAGGGVWTPAEITTALWLDAADSDTITLNGSNVSQWDDKSGNNRDVLQGTSSAQPGYATAAQNNLNTLTFDGGDFLGTAANFPLTGNAEFSIFVAYRKGSTNTEGCLLGWGNGINALGAVGLYNDGSLSLWAYAGGNSFSINSIGVSTDYIMGYTKRPGAINATSAAWRNGADDATSGHQTTTPNITAEPLRVGQWASYTLNRLIGSVYEVIVLPVEADTDTRQRIEGYLAWKWGLEANLPSDHPYKSVAP